MDILQSIRLLTHFGSTKRDTSLEAVDATDSPTQMLDRLIREAKEAGRKADMESVAALEGKPIESKAAKQWQKTKAEVPSTEGGMPEVPPGHVRYYHGTTYKDASSFSGKTYLTPHYDYAKNYRGQQNNVMFVDMAKDKAIESGLYDDINNFPINGSIENGAEVLKPLPVQSTSQPTSEPANDDAAAVVAAQQQLNQPQPEPASSHVSSDTAAIVAAQQRLSQPKPEPSNSSVVADTAQSALDAVGVVDPTPISDGVNALWSLGRAFTDPERRGEHLTNAAISAVSMVPYIGDTAKLLKGGRYAKTASRLAGMGEGASAATKASQRSSYRGMVENVTGANVGSNSSGGDSGNDGNESGGGGNVPPGTTPGSNSPDDDGDGGFLNSIRSAVDALSGIVGPAAKLALSIAASVKGLELFNSGIVALNRDLAEYSGDMAGAFAQFDADEIQRKMREGEAKDAPMSKLLEEQSELKDTIDKFTNPVQALGVGILAQVTRGTNFLLKATVILDPILDTVQKIADWLGKEDNNEGTAIQQFFRDVSDGRFDGADPKFKTPQRNGEFRPRDR
jgi:hypothetical protein